MPELKELLIREMQDLLHAENQLITALPKMASAAKNPKLREAFEKHLEQTKCHVQRLEQAFEMLGEEAEPKTCRAIVGLIEEAQETIQEGDGKEDFAADLALVAIAQKVEHYEISGYGTVKTIAKQIEERDVARLFGYTLGEEESTDFLLTELSKPILQEARESELVAP